MNPPKFGKTMSGGLQIEAGLRAIGKYSVRFRLFLSSYTTLFVLLSIRWAAHWQVQWPIVLATVSLALIGLWSTYSLLRSAKIQGTEDRLTVIQASDAGPDVAGYVATYLLPFLTTSEPGTLDLFAYVLFTLVVALIYIRSNMIQINPTLYLLAYRVTRVTVRTTGSRPFQAFLISRAKIELDALISASELSDDVYLARKIPKER